MKTRDEILEKYISLVQGIRNGEGIIGERPMVNTLGWVLGFTQEQIKHDLKYGI